MPPIPRSSETVQPSNLIMTLDTISAASTSLFARTFSISTRDLQRHDHVFGGTETPAQSDGGDIALDTDGVVRLVDDWQFRTGYTTVSLFCMLVLALMLGKFPSFYPPSVFVCDVDTSLA